LFSSDPQRLRQPLHPGVNEAAAGVQLKVREVLDVLDWFGQDGMGVAIAEGSMTNLSYHYGIEVMDNEAAGILSAKGTFDSVEFTNNTLVSI
jgi:hypothetical protein